MSRRALDVGLEGLQDRMMALGTTVGHALTDSVEILRQRDREGSGLVIAGDDAINKTHLAIERDALALIATQQPMARDLRAIAALLDIGTELERIGDYAKGIARVNLMARAGPILDLFPAIPRMAEIVGQMLDQALTAFIERDADLARAVSAQDQEVDALHNQVFLDLIALVSSDSEAADWATYLLWVGHHLERAADRVTNICERVVFTVEGELLELDTDLGPAGLN